MPFLNHLFLGIIGPMILDEKPKVSAAIPIKMPKVSPPMKLLGRYWLKTPMIATKMVSVTTIIIQFFLNSS